MKKQTKLVDCSSAVFVYDFSNRNNIKELDFERSYPLSELTNLKRLILTNFFDDRLLATFTLRIPFSEYGNIDSRLQVFINQLKKSSGCSNIKYLAVSELPSEKDEPIVNIILITDLEIYSLTEALNDEISKENDEDYFGELWGDDVFIDVPTQKELLTVFISAYNKSINIRIYNRSTKIIFKSRLQQPIVLWNEEADSFIRNKNLFDHPYHRSDETVDKTAGFVIVNEYSLYDTSSYTEELG